MYNTISKMDAKIDPAIFQFCAKFCNELEKTINVVSSPLAAAEVMMSLTNLGNYDSTGPLFSNCIQIIDGSNIPYSYLSLSPSLKSIKGVTLRRASKIYLKKDLYKLDRCTKKTAAEVFHVKVEKINFSKRVDAAKCINQWIEKKTKKKIKGFFEYENFGVDTHIVLVSCLYFKGMWQMKFDPLDTEETIFRSNNNESVNVFLMYRKEKYKYTESRGLDAQMVLLPFKNEEAEMLIILPKTVTGLDGILQKLANGYDLMADMSQMNQNYEIAVSIPRFTIESEINFTKVFHELGINTAIDKAVQKVIIEVNEEGTEPKLDPYRGGFIPRWRRRPIKFIADRPHLIVILCHNIPIIWVTFRGRFE